MQLCQRQHDAIVEVQCSVFGTSGLWQPTLPPPWRVSSSSSLLDSYSRGTSFQMWQDEHCWSAVVVVTSLRRLQDADAHFLFC